MELETLELLLTHREAIVIARESNKLKHLVILNNFAHKICILRGRLAICFEIFLEQNIVQPFDAYRHSIPSDSDSSRNSGLESAPSLSAAKHHSQSTS